VRGGGQAAQHVRRILWRLGDPEVDSFIFVTTRVNYGVRPTGCIAIAAVWETAERFGKGTEEAAWFLKNRTYEDDATGGSMTERNVMRVSADMDNILGNGGFQFKETVMSGDPLDETGKLRKVFWGSGGIQRRMRSAWTSS
jgi:hypothetical protein